MHISEINCSKIGVQMNIEEFRDYCLAFPKVTEGFPFGEQTLVFKVAGKLFALTDVDNFESINLKCNPEKAIQLREEFNEIKPGYHMNKKHWNTVETSGSLSDAFLYEQIEESYKLVVAGLPKKVRDQIKLIR